MCMTGCDETPAPDVCLEYSSLCRRRVEHSLLMFNTTAECVAAFCFSLVLLMWIINLMAKLQKLQRREKSVRSFFISCWEKKITLLKAKMSQYETLKQVCVCAFTVGPPGLSLNVQSCHTSSGSLDSTDSVREVLFHFKIKPHQKGSTNKHTS